MKELVLSKTRHVTKSIFFKFNSFLLTNVESSMQGPKTIFLFIGCGLSFKEEKSGFTLLFN